MSDGPDDATTRLAGDAGSGARGGANCEPTRILAPPRGGSDPVDVETLGRALGGRYRLDCELGAGGMGRCSGPPTSRSNAASR